jgi:hypothetical protein
MNWLTNNWVWVALALGFLAMHLFGHGGHGGHGSGHGHGRHGDGDANTRPQSPEAQTSGTAQPSEPDRAAHSHGSGVPGFRPGSSPIAAGDGVATQQRSAHERHNC